MVTLTLAAGLREARHTGLARSMLWQARQPGARGTTTGVSSRGAEYIQYQVMCAVILWCGARFLKQERSTESIEDADGCRAGH